MIFCIRVANMCHCFHHQDDDSGIIALMMEADSTFEASTKLQGLTILKTVILKQERLCTIVALIL